MLREGANAFMADVPRPPIRAVEHLTADGPRGAIAMRLYRSSLNSDSPVILFAHGGGFLLGGLDTHDAMCRALANRSRAAVLAIDYSLSPEARHPAALEDIAAIHALVRRKGQALTLDPERIAIVGDSAGGYLAAVSALTLPVRHVGLIYPMIDPDHMTPSAREFAAGYMLTGSFVAWAWEAYGSSTPDMLARADMAKYPPTTLVTAEFDPLRDEGEAFGDWLRATGRDVVVERFAGMIHGFVGMPHLTPRAEDAINLVADRIRASLTG